MRTILTAMLAAAAIGLVGTLGTSAAPLTGAGIQDAAATVDPVDQVWDGHWRWGSHGHWRWGSHGHWRWGSRW